MRPNQRVLFEHGSLREVVDHESEPCGCPPAELVAGTTAAGVGASKGPPFPLAESEGLAPVPQLTTQAAVPVGETQTQVTVPLTYNGAVAPVSPAPFGWFFGSWLGGSSRFCSRCWHRSWCGQGCGGAGSWRAEFISLCRGYECEAGESGGR